MTNTTHFGTPIESMGDQYDAKEERYGPYTSKAAIHLATLLAKVMGEKTPSPKQIDFFVKGMFGSIGDMALKAASAPLDGPGSQKKAGLEYAPIIGKFLIGPGEGGSRTTDQFYNDVSRSQKVLKKAKKIYKSGDTLADLKKKGDFNQRDMALIQNHKGLNSISSSLAKLRKELKVIQSDPDKSPQQKRQAQMKFNYFTELATGYFYGKPIPKIPAELSADENELNKWIECFSSPPKKRLEQ
jgi:hypothetical protein